MSHSSSIISVLPKSVDQLSKHLKTSIVDSPTLQSLINLASRYWKGDDITSQEWELISKSSYLPLSMLEELFSGVLSLTMAIFRIPEKAFSNEAISEELVQLGLTVEQAEYMLQLKKSSNPKIPEFLKLNNVNWRIDITISTSNASHILQPWVLLELEFTTGDIKTIHLPLAQFHSLRYQVANCLGKLNKV